MPSSASSTTRRRDGRRARIAACAGLLAAALGCSSVADELAAAEELWRRTRPTSYRIELVAEGAVRRRIAVVVRNGEPVDAVLREGGAAAPVALSAEHAYPYTVCGLFQTLREELAAGRRRVTARFDPRWGLPRRIELAEGFGPTAPRQTLRVVAFVALAPEGGPP